MNRNEFNRFITGIDIPGPGDLDGLRELTTLFPWFHSAHMLLLRGLKENSDIRFDTQLKTSALSVADRAVLYHYVFLFPEAGITDSAPFLREELLLHPEAETAAENSPVSPADAVPGQIDEEEKTDLQAEDHAEQETILPEEAEEKAEITPEEGVVTGDFAGEAVETVDAMELQSEETVGEVTAEETPEEIPEEVPEIAPAEAPEETQEEKKEEYPGVIPEEAPAMEQEVPPTEAPGEMPEEEQEVPPTEAPGEMPEEEQEVPPGETYEQIPQNLPETATATDTSLRTREELIAEIEARLRELEHADSFAVEAETETTVPSEESSAVFSPDVMPEPQKKAVDESETEPQFTAEFAAEMQYEPEADFEAEMQYEPEVEPGPAPEPAPGELLELLPDEPADKEEHIRQLTPADLIDRFISVSPTIERMTPGEYQPVKDLSEDNSDEQGAFITETLANIYINQGYYTKAINIYEKLSLQFPEKSAYFASRIEKIRDLIK